MSKKVSVICIIRNDREYFSLIKENFMSFDYPQDDLELLVLDDGPENMMDHFLDWDRTLYMHMSQDDIAKYIQKISFKGDNDNVVRNYHLLSMKLPMGFKRDLAVGSTSHDYIFHMDFDMSYNPNVIKRKLKFLETNKMDCVYSDHILCYDKDNDHLYKSQSQYKIYEGTLLHTREYWKSNGFKWDDIMYEGRNFKKGLHKLHENYYDFVKILTIKNCNDYRPVRIDTEKSTFDYKVHESAKEISLGDFNPVKNAISSLFHKSELNVLGIHSNSIDSLESETHLDFTRFNEDFNPNKLSKKIKALDKEFHVLLYGYKKPVWEIFENVEFKMIILDTYKNAEQMQDIVSKCKKYDYYYIDGRFINKNILAF